MTRYRATFGWTAACAVVMAMLANVAVPLEVQAQPPAVSEAEAHDYDDLLRIYRSGAIEHAVDVLAKLLAASEGQRQVNRWIGRAQEANRRTDLEAALLMYSDAIMIAWRHDDPYPTRLLERYMSPFQRLRLTLERMDPKSLFLKAWYLMWESFRQVHGQRSDAAATATLALSNRSDQSDPWWPYLRGQAWRFEAYLKIARSMVIK